MIKGKGETYLDGLRKVELICVWYKLHTVHRNQPENGEMSGGQIYFAHMVLVMQEE